MYTYFVMEKEVTVIGGGLAGAEASYFLASHGIKVTLYEMRPLVSTGAHHTSKIGELVCSNSLKNKAIDNACGLLKKEMEEMGSLLMEIAYQTSVASGAALAVDREEFSRRIDEKIRQNPNILVKNEEIADSPKGIVIIATGPLTSPKLVESLKKIIGENTLSFFDASAPIVELNSIDLNKAYFKSRYDKGEGVYLNCAFTEEEYKIFYKELINAKTAPTHSFDTAYFEGCMPVEVMAKRGVDTLRYGPLKPKGLRRFEGDHPYAVCQLRQDNLVGDLYNIVGFQTNLTYGEQKRVFSLIPGLENASFVRYGLMHRNSYVKAPVVLNDTLQLKANSSIILAGQLTGVEGYVESGATGIVAGINAMRLINNQKPLQVPTNTMLGALLFYITHAEPNSFQPMNSNFGIMYGVSKLNREEKANEAISSIRNWFGEINE